jgi:hypothetical protein
MDREHQGEPLAWIFPSSVERYNSPKRSAENEMMRMKRFRLLSALLIGFVGLAANAAPAPWDQPASNLSDQVAAILGPGQAHLTIRNLSTIPIDQIPVIRRLFEQDLKAHGVLASGTESANTIRVTLSENSRERLWVAEVIEGNETRVAMVSVDSGSPQKAQSATGITLRRQAVFAAGDKILAALETANGLVLVEPEQIVIETHAANSWQVLKTAPIGQTRPLTRDPRAVILPIADGSAANGTAFVAYLAGSRCTGTLSAAEWTIRCHESDDPWPIRQLSNLENAPSLKAFSNASRNYFTDVVTPSLGVDLPPFYSATLLPQADGTAFLISSIDGKIQILANGKLRSVAGTRDWGSDIAALNTGCGAGTQIIASSSGEAIADSLRAYDLPGQEAIPASAALAMDGTVTALWNAADSKSLFAVVRSADNRYEVDRVTANCN